MDVLEQVAPQLRIDRVGAGQPLQRRAERGGGADIAFVLR